MTHEKLLPRALRGEPHFRWRGGDVSRIENLSDVVFAFALTLIVVSLQVPRNVGELVAAIVQFPVFAVCFTLLIYCWYHNYLFHRRYGLEGLVPMTLNSLLLFFVLFYVYPLKFVFTAMYLWIPPVRRIVAAATDDPLPGFEGGNGRTVMLFFSAGFTGIFILLTLMNRYAWRHRAALELDAQETIVARGAIRGHLLSAIVGMASLLLALGPDSIAPLSGMIYFVMGPLHFANGYLTGRAAEKAAA